MQHGGNIFLAARKNRVALEGLLDFSANINPLGLSSKIKEALLQHLEWIVHYPDPDAHDLKEHLADCYNLSTSQLILGNGAVELLYLLCHIKRPKAVLVQAPTFSEYERAAQSVGAKVYDSFLKEEQLFQTSLSSLLWDIQLFQPDIVFLCNPNNPTGVLLKKHDIEWLLKRLPEGIDLVVDESFQDFLDQSNENEYSAKPLLTQYPNLFVLHSLTKFYAIPGLRLGFMAGPAEWISHINGAKDPWNVNTLAQVAGIAGIEDENYQQQSRSYVKRENQRFYGLLKQFSCCQVYKPTVNYILLNICQSGFTVDQLQEELWSHGILVRNCQNYRGLSEFHMRLAVRKKEENDLLVETLSKYWNMDSR